MSAFYHTTLPPPAFHRNSEEQCTNCKAVVRSALVSFQRESDVKNTKWGSFRKESLERPCEKALSSNSPAIKLHKIVKSWLHDRSPHFPSLFSAFFLSYSPPAPIPLLFPEPSSRILYTPSPSSFQPPLFTTSLKMKFLLNPFFLAVDFMIFPGR